jgi:hypothetical protein
VSPLRDQAEALLRGWDAYERARGGEPVIDFDCHPNGADQIRPVSSRREVLDQVEQLLARAYQHDEQSVSERLTADRAYLLALLGSRTPLVPYLAATQGTAAAGWSSDYLDSRLSAVKDDLTVFGLSWGPDLLAQLDDVEGPIEPAEAGEAIRQAAVELEPEMRRLTGSSATFDLTIQTADVDAYWSYWLDGQGSSVRLRLNERNLSMTKVRARQFALHEVLGHGLQYASIAAHAATHEVPWVRLLSVHGPHQVLFEGLASALPLFVQPQDDALRLRVHLDLYTQLVRGQLHLAINAGSTLDECFGQARTLVPFWSDDQIGNVLTDRTINPLLRSYLWSYPAGLDWFTRLSEAASGRADEVIRAAYQEPLTPCQLQSLWPDGAPIGGA